MNLKFWWMKNLQVYCYMLYSKYLIVRIANTCQDADSRCRVTPFKEVASLHESICTCQHTNAASYSISILQDRAKLQYVVFEIILLFSCLFSAHVSLERVHLKTTNMHSAYNWDVRPHIAALVPSNLEYFWPRWLKIQSIHLGSETYHWAITRSNNVDVICIYDWALDGMSAL